MLLPAVVSEIQRMTRFNQRLLPGAEGPLPGAFTTTNFTVRPIRTTVVH